MRSKSEPIPRYLRLFISPSEPGAELAPGVDHTTFKEVLSVESSSSQHETKPRFRGKTTISNARRPSAATKKQIEKNGLSSGREGGLYERCTCGSAAVCRRPKSNGKRIYARILQLPNFVPHHCRDHRESQKGRKHELET